MTTMEEVAGWLEEEGERIYNTLIDPDGDSFACDCSRKWYTRANQVKAMGWQPIADAPKDGLIIDLWDSSAKERMVECAWLNESWHQFYPPDEWVEIMHGKITHFMHLPQPPP